MSKVEPESERLIRLLIFASLFTLFNFVLACIGVLLCCDLRIYWLESFCNGLERIGIGIIFLFGSSLFCVGTYGRLPWFSKHNNSKAATIIGIGIMIFAFLMGHGGVAERNEAYCRGYDDGLHKRHPVDFRLSDSSKTLIKFWMGKQHSNLNGNE